MKNEETSQYTQRLNEVCTEVLGNRTSSNATQSEAEEILSKLGKDIIDDILRNFKSYSVEVRIIYNLQNILKNKLNNKTVCTLWAKKSQRKLTKIQLSTKENLCR